MTNVSGDSGEVLYRDARDRTQRAVAALLKDSGLHIRELTYELVITNPEDPEKGQIHVAYDDGYVSWERVVWSYWNLLEGLGDACEGKVSAAKIIRTLKGQA